MSDVIDISTRAAVLPRERLLAYVELAKPRITSLALLATVLGFYLAWPGPLVIGTGWLLLNALIGTTLVGAGANTLNQYLEADFDSMMERTASRPLPSGRLTPVEVLAFGVGVSCIGLIQLLVLVNPLTALIAAITLVSYVLVYTPMKRVTSMCVFIGAVPGALPPVIGWAAASGSLALESWLLFAIIYVWQLPHFAAIAWLYREDYGRAGYPMLPVVDPSGMRTTFHVITHSVGLLAVSLLPTFYRLTGPVYAGAAMVLGILFLALGVAFVTNKTKGFARLHLLGSVTYLSLLFLAMMLDKAGGAWLLA